MLQWQDSPSILIKDFSSLQHVSIINFNGKIQTISTASGADNVSFVFSDGFFETILVVKGEVQMPDYHYERIAHSLSQAHVFLPSWFTQSFFQAAIKKVIQLYPKFLLARVRFEVTIENDAISYAVSVGEILHGEWGWSKYGWSVGIMSSTHKTFDQAGNAKKINPNFYSQTKAVASQHNWHDVLIENQKNIIESSIANVFWVKNGSVFTPPLASGCVAGTMRRYILENTKNFLPIKEKPLSKELLFEADEVFLTNAIRRIRWIRRIENHNYSNQITNEIFDYLWH
ncbi:MAG: aminotransferase class IV [Bacteroidetes bacterium]|nr:aminotransferase class IV [Bacteroidota bacterium]